MAATSTFSTVSRSGARPNRLPAGVAFYLQASIVVAFLAASAAPTPLYAIYQARWGFSSITTTVVFGVYALAVLASLLTVGRLSDHVGRRPVLLTAIGMQAVAMLVITTASGVPELLLARVIQGLSAGAAIGAVGAGMLDLNKAKGTFTNSIAPLVGNATGSIVAGLLVQYLPAPTHLVFLLLFGIFLVQGVGVLLMAETATPKPGALASLRPTVGVPQAARRPVLVAVPVLIAVWALGGFYGSIGPALVHQIVGSTSIVLGGLAPFVLAASGAVAVSLLRNAAPRTVMLSGIVALVVGVAITLIAVAASSTALFFVGTAVAGVGFGGGFQGTIRTVVPLAATHERAGLLSTLYVVSYLGLGLPAVVAGYLVVHGGGILSTAREYGIAVMVLAAVALPGVLRPKRQSVQEPLAATVPAADLAEMC
jgi:predicted MFS family arabinose efflux permease